MWLWVILCWCDAERLAAAGDRTQSWNVGDSAGAANQTDSRSDIIVELSTQISEQETKLQRLQADLEDRDALITKLTAASQCDAQSIIQIEAEKASQDVQLIAKDLKKKLKKRRAAKAISSLPREESTLSRDSGAEDLNHLHVVNSGGSAEGVTALTYSLINPYPSQSATLDSTRTRVS